MADPALTPQQQQQAASAAWLAQNAPQLVSTPSTSAEQAAATNAAYRNNTLPFLPVNGDPVGTYGYNMNADYSGMSQAQRAALYMQDGTSLSLMYQNGSPVYLTPQ